MGGNPGPGADAYHLGIDLGTTWTAAAVRRGSSTTMVTLGNRTPEIPSVAYLTPEGELLVGEAAERRAAEDPTRVAREWKRRYGDPTAIMIGGTPWSAQGLSARLLRAVVQRVSEREGGPPSTVAVTHPANWGPFKLDLLRQALQLADLPEARTMTEPEAAARHYASAERVEVGDVVAVYDLGGGTFDAAVLEKTAGGFTVLGVPQGIEQLGGIDFDEAVYRYVRDALGSGLHRLDLDDPAVVRGLARLRRECVEAKEALSSDTVVTLPVVLPPLHTEVRLTRGEFEALTAPLLQDTVGALRRALASAGVEAEQLRAVVLIGGSSRIPLVAELVGSALGRPVALDAHPKHAVALGAAGPDRSAAVAASGTPPGTPPGTPQPDTSPDTPDSAAAPGTPVPQQDPSRPTGRPVPSRRLRLVAGAAAGVVALTAAAAVAMTSLGGDEAGGSGGGGEPTSTRGPGFPRAAEPLPDDVLLHVETVNESLQVVRRPAAAGSQSEVVAGEIGIDDKLPVLLPGRRSLVYVRSASNGAPASLHLAATDGTGDVLLSSEWGADSRPSFHPDGTRIVYEARDPTTGQSDIWTARLGEVRGVPVLQDRRNLTQDPATNGDPAWSPDGTRIVFWTRNATQDLVVHDVADDSVQTLVDLPDADEVDPAWSPDSRTVVFSRQSGPAVARRSVLMQVASDGGPPELLYQDPAGSANDPHFAPDGASIAFQVERSLEGERVAVQLLSVRPDGTGLVLIAARDNGWLGHLAWSARA